MMHVMVDTCRFESCNLHVGTACVAHKAMIGHEEIPRIHSAFRRNDNIVAAHKQLHAET